MKLTPTWLPNWRDSSAYPAEKASPYQFAWEFLRRNPGYQRDYADWCGSSTDTSALATLLKKYAILDMYDPKTKYVPGSADRPQFKLLGAPALISTGSMRIEDDEIGIKINRHLPLAKQLDWAKRMLETHQTHSRLYMPQPYKRSLEKHAEHLRLLDADSNGICVDEIIAVLAPTDRNDPPDYPAKRAIEARLERAKALCCGGYKYLLFSGPPLLRKKSEK
jgi:hypothetical protein